VARERARLQTILFTHRYAVALILLHAGLLTWSALANSVAVDEYAHLPAGVSYWRSGGHFSIYDQSPPLLRLIAAAPVVFAGAEAPPVAAFEAMPAKDRHWNYAYAFLRANADRYQRLFVIGRLPMILLSCLGAWIVYRWASSLYGPAAALLPCAVYVLCPNIAAHASLVGTDTGTAVFMLLAAWLWWRFCRSRSKASWLGAALAIGAAHLCKFTALLLWPMLAGMALCVLRNEPWRERRRGMLGFALGFAAAAVVTLLIVDLGYLFEGTRLTMPLPRPLVEGFIAQRAEFQAGLASFLFGRQYAHSHWYYYPTALLLKTPLATLILLAAAMVRRRFNRDEAAVLAALVIFLLGAIFLSGADLGVRYVLPALPLAFVLIGRIAKATWRAWPTALLALLLIENLLAAPWYLTSFNLLAGGRSHAQTLLNDSNFDWGTGLVALRQWMRDNHVERVQLGYFGRVDPTIYGIDYDLITQKSGEPYVAISSHYLVGLPYRLPTRDGFTGWISLPFREQLNSKPRVAVLAGGQMHIFRREDVARAMQEYQLIPQSPAR
jgi:hypothetical protein